MKMDKNTGNLFAVLIAALALAALLYMTSRRKDTDLMSVPDQKSGSGPTPSPSLGQSDNYGGAYGVKTSTYGAQGVKTEEPSVLLPNDSNSQWASLNPQGGGMLKNINLLQAGSLVGINTVGSSLRNANLQVRSEPPNPQGNVGPWNHSTIEPDFVRKPLELGELGNVKKF
jgi:hypothetical protein